jgi:glycosyltransferase involved in cell wall biosynthesis
VFSTPEEQELAQQRFALPLHQGVVVGAGVDPPPARASTANSRRDRDRQYVVCVGRIDPSKGTDTLLRHHAALVANDPSAPDLVLLGPAAMEVSTAPWLETPGFVTEEEKHATIADAIALVCPSPFESLSLVLLEAWANAVPTIATAESPVLVGQSCRAGAGLWYRDEHEYGECVQLLAQSPALGRALGFAGRRFTRRLSWSRITDTLLAAIEGVAAQSRTGGSK